MGLSFLQQLLTVACLAFASGLLLGVAVLRGEVGGLRNGAGAAATEAAQSGKRRKPRKPFSLSRAVKTVAQAAGDIDPALKWVLVSLAVMLTVSAAITRLIE